MAGEALVDLVPAPVPEYFEARPGGSPANVAVGLARLGVPARMLARIADDMLGRRLRDHLAANDVDLTHVVPATEQTSMAMVALGADGVPSYDFRIAGTADWQWTADELKGALDGPVVALHSGSLALTMQPGAAVLRELMAQAAATATISYDPNCRPLLMGDPADVLAGRARAAGGRGRREGQLRGPRLALPRCHSPRRSSRTGSAAARPSSRSPSAATACWRARPTGCGCGGRACSSR